jgi:hypothetical protein
MTLHIEQHTVRRRTPGAPKTVLVLVTDQGVIVATFKSAAAAKLYTEQVALTWMFAHQAGRMGV